MNSTATNVGKMAVTYKKLQEDTKEKEKKKVD